MTTAEDPRGWRVKLYHLNESGEWDDQGTGYIRCKYDEVGGVSSQLNNHLLIVFCPQQSASTSIYVVDEDENNQPLLVTNVVEEDIYQRQGGRFQNVCVR